MKDTDSIKSQLFEMTTSFCKMYLDEEYEQLSVRMIEKMARKRSIPFTAGRTEIWAAAIIHSLGQINFLYDKKVTPHISLDQLIDYFKVSKSTVGQKAKIIRDMFKMQYWDGEFSTTRMKQNNPFANLAVVSMNGTPFIVPKSNLNELFSD